MWTHVQCMACVLTYQHLLFGQRICCGLFLWTGFGNVNRVREKETKIKLTWDISTKKNLIHAILYRSNRSFNILPPPPATPPRIWLFWKLSFKFPPTQAKIPFKCPRHTRVHSGDQTPPPQGHFTGIWMTEGRQKRLQFSNKIFKNIANNSHSI